MTTNGTNGKAGMLDRIPPQAVEAELAVLGSMLLSADAAVAALEALDATDFYAAVNRELFGLFRRMAGSELAIDVTTVCGELRKLERLAPVGGAEYVIGLTNEVATAAHIDHYAAQVKDASVRRAVIEAGTRMVVDGFSSSDSKEALERAERAVFALAEGGTRKGTTRMGEDAHEMMEEVEKRYVTKRPVTGLATGFPTFDKITTGLHPGNLMIVAARPGMGKTSLALNIVQNVAIGAQLPVLVFSLEMSKQELFFRLLASLSSVDAGKIKTGFCRRDELAQLAKAGEVLGEAPIYINDSSSISALSLRSEAAKLATKLVKAGTPLSLVVVDYLQLMASGRKAENRQLEVGDISRSMKGMARDLNVPVIALSQLNRSPEERGRDGKPKLSDLRDSGAIEQDADLVAFVFRPGMYESGATDEVKCQTKLIVAKQRNGPLADIELYFQKHLTRFVETCKEDEGPEQV